ncbi:MAG: hypothetical protein CL463_06585 [Acidimicrobiaceae bacterium]|nr:hypothetical protein [Acidimicrobiaceae bacterium]
MEQFEDFYRGFKDGAIDPDDYWPLWRNVWDSCEDFTSFFEGDIAKRDHILGAIFSEHVHLRSAFMTPEENVKLLSLAGHVNIFRGGQQANIAGWLWTLDREYAEQRARSGATDNRPLLAVVSSLPSSAILAYIEKDGISELIVDPLTITIETGDYGNIIFERL